MLTFFCLIYYNYLKGIIGNKEFFLNKKAFCTILGAFCIVGCACHLVTQLLLALNRYINMCWSEYYKRIFTIKKTILACFLSWVAALGIESPNLIGWGGHRFDLKSANCMWDRVASKSHSCFFILVAIVTPCVLIGFCYTRIYLYVMASKRRVQGSTNNGKAKNKINLETIKIARSCFSSFALFVICW
jgi:hypothetical protein